MKTQKTATVAMDAVELAPESYRVLLENDRVRVLEFHSARGEKTAMHSHPDSLIYSFNPAMLLITTPYGVSEEFEIRTGELFWRDGTRHATQNIGDTDAHCLVIELKE
jgi:quercetin dioxygenase-like cupin family protein